MNTQLKSNSDSLEVSITPCSENLRDTILFHIKKTVESINLFDGAALSFQNALLKSDVANTLLINMSPYSVERPSARNNLEGILLKSSSLTIEQFEDFIVESEQSIDHGVLEYIRCNLSNWKQNEIKKVGIQLPVLKM